MLLYSNGSFYNEWFGEYLVIFSPILEYYPYDKQNVTITFESASYPDSTVNIQPHPTPLLVNNPLSFNVSNIEWDILSGDLYIYE